MKKMNNKKQNNEGFTLVELIIVVAIIALLIAMIAPNLTSFLGTAGETTMNANAKTAYTTANAWLTDMKVNKHTIKDGDIVITGGATPSATYPTGSYDPADNEEIVNMFNSAELGTGVKVTITVKDGFATKAVWHNDSEPKDGEYPQ